jgi:hypothetical protein
MDTLQEFAAICSVKYHEEFQKELEFFGIIIHKYTFYIKVSNGTYHSLEDVMASPACSTKEFTMKQIRSCPEHLIRYMKTYIEDIRNSKPQ